jgi:hypothetical protein
MSRKLSSEYTDADMPPGMTLDFLDQEARKGLAKIDEKTKQTSGLPADEQFRVLREICMYGIWHKYAMSQGENAENAHHVAKYKTWGVYPAEDEL